MQDRFKFRVWNKENKKLYDWDFLEKTKGENTFFWVMHQAQNDCKNNILMQCTGLKDKNGKLIYEGDIVKDKCSEAVATIEYLPYTFSLMAHIRGMDDYLPLEDICYALEVATPFEVIGNIYENPELLEVSNDH